MSGPHPAAAGAGAERELAAEATPMAAAARKAVETLQRRGHTAYWAGGCVRDLLLGRDPKDYDIATSATPDQVKGLFTRTGGGPCP